MEKPRVKSNADPVASAVIFFFFQSYYSVFVTAIFFLLLFLPPRRQILYFELNELVDCNHNNQKNAGKEDALI